MSLLLRLIRDNLHLFQVVRANKVWPGAQNVVRKNLGKLLNTALQSRADSTTKTYIRIIRKFFVWRKANEIPLNCRSIAQ